jgi:hypothetical protein
MSLLKLTRSFIALTLLAVVADAAECETSSYD